MGPVMKAAGAVSDKWSGDEDLDDRVADVLADELAQLERKQNSRGRRFSLLLPVVLVSIATLCLLLVEARQAESAWAVALLTPGSLAIAVALFLVSWSRRSEEEHQNSRELLAAGIAVSVQRAGMAIRESESIVVSEDELHMLGNSPVGEMFQRIANIREVSYPFPEGIVSISLNSRSMDELHLLGSWLLANEEVSSLAYQVARIMVRREQYGEAVDKARRACYENHVSARSLNRFEVLFGGTRG